MSPDLIQAIISLIIIALIVIIPIIVHVVKKSSFTNDEIEVNDSYENKHLFEQQVFQMLNPKNKKVYLNLPEDEKNMFLSDVEKK
jgi:hypothetical protein